MSSPTLHPLIDNGLTAGSSSFPGGTLTCKCASNPVKVSIKGNVAHNHACGCSKCWKPQGALFSVVGVVPVDSVSVAAGEGKLHVVDQEAVIQRNACRECGVHMFGRIHKEHPFVSGCLSPKYPSNRLRQHQSPRHSTNNPPFPLRQKGLDFVHPELGNEKGWQEPQFAAFVSSIIEQGFDPEKMGDVRGKFKSVGLETYDCLSPALMDLIASFTAKQTKSK